jgi:hypothetical protein
MIIIQALCVVICLDCEVDGRHGGDTHHDQYQKCLESHSELELNEQFKFVAVYLKCVSFGP